MSMWSMTVLRTENEQRLSIESYGLMDELLALFSQSLRLETCRNYRCEFSVFSYVAISQLVMRVASALP